VLQAGDVYSLVSWETVTDSKGVNTDADEATVWEVVTRRLKTGQTEKT
jgi:hypothetical protein